MMGESMEEIQKIPLNLISNIRKLPCYIFKWLIISVCYFDFDADHTRKNKAYVRSISSHLSLTLSKQGLQILTFRRFGSGVCMSFTVDFIIYKIIAFLLQVLLTVSTDKTVRVAILLPNLHHRPTGWQKVETSIRKKKVDMDVLIKRSITSHTDQTLVRNVNDFRDKWFTLLF